MFSARAVSGGQRSARYAACGVWFGYLIHVALVSFGVATLLQSSPAAFKAVKIAGAVYLLWIGSSVFFGKKNSVMCGSETSSSGRSLFKQGFFVSALNPKVAVFFLAYLPQFVDPAKGDPALQLAFLGFVFSLSATFVNMTVGYFEAG